MRIGILCHPTYGGSGVVASELALHLAERKHEVHLFSHATPPRLAKGNQSVRVHVARAMPYPVFEAPPHDLAVTSRILDVQARHGLDVLHAHYAIPNATSALLAQAAVRQAGHKLPVVTTLHGTDITLVGSDPSYVALTNYALRASDAVTCVSKSLANDTARTLLQGADIPLRIIPNFVDCTRYRTELPRRATRVQVLHASNFRPLKRVLWLIEAFAECLSLSTSNAELVLVGHGPDRQAAEARVVELGIQDHVDFLGERNDLEALLTQADVFALSSEQESFGLASLEAMAAGLPVVSTRVGGVSEVVQHNDTGLLCKVEDQHGFAKSLANLIDDEELRRAMGEAGKNRARINFSPDTIVDRYEALYREVLEI